MEISDFRQCRPFHKINQCLNVKGKRGPPDEFEMQEIVPKENKFHRRSLIKMGNQNSTPQNYRVRNSPVRALVITATFGVSQIISVHVPFRKAKIHRI